MSIHKTLTLGRKLASLWNKKKEATVISVSPQEEFNPFDPPQHWLSDYLLSMRKDLIVGQPMNFKTKRS